jgi:hypothetical protein
MNADMSIVYDAMLYVPIVKIIIYTQLKMNQTQPTASELAKQKKAKQQKLYDKKLELLMSMYHKLTYSKVLRIAMEYGIVKHKSPDVIAELALETNSNTESNESRL